MVIDLADETLSMVRYLILKLPTLIGLRALKGLHILLHKGSMLLLSLLLEDLALVLEGNLHV